MPEVAICTDNVVLLTMDARILLKGEWLECLPQYFNQHLSVCVLLLIQPLLTNIAVLEWNLQQSNHYDGIH